MLRLAARKNSTMLTKRMLGDRASRAKASIKRRARTILVRIPYFDAKIRDWDVNQAYERILNSSFEPKLYSELEQLQITEIEINRNCNLDCVMCNTSLS